MYITKYIESTGICEKLPVCATVWVYKSPFSGTSVFGVIWLPYRGELIWGILGQPFISSLPQQLKKLRLSSLADKSVHT